MPKRLRKRTRRSAAERRARKLKGFELDISPEELWSDLNFGVGSPWETVQIAQELPSESGRAQ